MLTTIKTFYVAGVSFRPADIIDALGENEKIRLVAEPENKFDANAIKIECEFTREQDDIEETGAARPPERTWEHIGYVPKGETWLYHLLRQLNIPIQLRMDVNPTAEPHRRLLVSAAVETNPKAPFVQ